jgi:hypothetical protein
MQLDRTDEATFRASVPRTVQGTTILEVLGFRPGGFGVYASAVALGRGGSDHRHSTHLLVCMDDTGDDYPTWVLYHGHYDHPDRDTAKADLLNRAGYTVPPRPARR